MDEAKTHLFSIAQKTILVTGGSRGIGWALAEGCAAANARVVALGRSATPQVPFESLVDYRVCDICNGEAVKRTCREIAKAYGEIHALVNCAGISRAQDRQEPMEPFLATLETNLHAVYRVMIEVKPYMKTGGSIINMTSLAAGFGMPENPGYVASKGGLSALTRSLALDWGKEGIRVNSIRPGYILTDMTRRSYEDPALNRERLQRMILPRWGTPGDLLGAVIFLASEASAYVTGSEIVVDGGWSAKGL